MTPEFTLLTFLLSCGGKREQGVSDECQHLRGVNWGSSLLSQPQHPGLCLWSGPSLRWTQAQLEPRAPSPRRGWVLLTSSQRQARWGTLAKPRPRDVAGHLCWAGATGKKSPSPALLLEAIVHRPPPPAACPRGSLVNVNSNREPGHGVWRDNMCHQGHPQTLHWALSLSGGSSGRCCSGARGHRQAWV